MKTVKNKELTRTILNDLFIQQARSLSKEGVPFSIIDSLTKRRGALYDLVMSSSEYSDHSLVPFIPIVPVRNVGEFESLLSYYNVRKIDGFNFNRVINIIEAPREPYFLLGVHRNMEYPKGLQPEKRSPLLMIEVMALHFHCHNLLTEHHLNAVGSKCPDPSREGTEEDVVNLFLNPYRQAMLRPSLFYVPGAEGSPSCAGRF